MWTENFFFVFPILLQDFRCYARQMSTVVRFSWHPARRISLWTANACRMSFAHPAPILRQQRTWRDAWRCTSGSKVHARRVIVRTVSRYHFESCSDSAEHGESLLCSCEAFVLNTSIAFDQPCLCWLPCFATQVICEGGIGRRMLVSRWHPREWDETTKFVSVFFFFCIIFAGGVSGVQNVKMVTEEKEQRRVVFGPRAAAIQTNWPKWKGCRRVKLARPVPVTVTQFDEKMTVILICGLHQSMRDLSRSLELESGTWTRNTVGGGHEKKLFFANIPAWSSGIVFLFFSSLCNWWEKTHLRVCQHNLKSSLFQILDRQRFKLRDQISDHSDSTYDKRLDLSQRTDSKESFRGPSVSLSQDDKISNRICLDSVFAPRPEMNHSSEITTMEETARHFSVILILHRFFCAVTWSGIFFSSDEFLYHENSKTQGICK